MEHVEVFYFRGGLLFSWRSTIVYKSPRGIIFAIEDLEILLCLQEILMSSICYRSSLGLLSAIEEDLEVFYRKQRTSRHSIENKGPQALLYTTEVLKVIHRQQMTFSSYSIIYRRPCDLLLSIEDLWVTQNPFTAKDRLILLLQKT